MVEPDFHRFDTRALHAGQRPDPTTGSRAVPIHQTTSYVFDSVDHAAGLFNLEVSGHLYSRISNPTVAVLEERIASLEGGVGAVCTASGQAAFHLAMATILHAGDHVVASRNIYGGSHNILNLTMPRFGITTSFVDPRDPAAFAEAIRPETRLVFAETLGNPGIEVLDILTFRTEDTDYSAQITKIKSLNPDGVGLGSCYQNAAGIIKEARRQGLSQPFVGGACTGAPALIELGGKATEGTYVSTAAWMDDPADAIQAFVGKIKARNGNKAFPYSAPRGYDSLLITANCMNDNGITNEKGDLASDREKIKKCWANVKNYPGVSGSTTMNEVGDGAGGNRVLKVVDGKYVDISG
mgnify:CR=1 FL=1